MTVNMEVKDNSQEKCDSPQSSSDYRLRKDDEDIRVYAAITFAFLLIVIGIPLWWKTTEVYRVHVPYGRIDDLKDIDITFPIRIIVASKDDMRANSIVKHLTSSVSNDKSGVADVHYEKGITDMEKVLTAGSLTVLDDIDLFPNIPGQLVLLEVPGMLRFTLSNVVIGSKRIVYFSQEASEQLLESVVHHWLTQADALFRTRASMEAPNEWETDKMGRRRMPPAAQYDLMVSVVHPEPDRRDILWDVQHAIKVLLLSGFIPVREVMEKSGKFSEDQEKLTSSINVYIFSISNPETVQDGRPHSTYHACKVVESNAEHMGDLIDVLSPVVKLRTKSQWLYLVRLEGRPRQVANEEGVWYSLSEDILPHIITPLEKKLGSSVGQYPTIQLVVYIPPCQTSPLLITSNKHSLPPSTAFLSPRWGGVQIYNPPSLTCGSSEDGTNHPHKPNSTFIMSTFRKQLKLLIGVPELVPLIGVEQLPLPANGIRDWELDSLMRMRTLEHLISARITLKSLAQLLDEISNIVITDEVGALIWEAITKSHDSINHMLAGQLHAGFRASQDAFLAAETAFSDPSLLALLYFPDDQKYAVYIPLFLPVMIPVLMSLKSIRTWWLTGTTERRVDKEKQE